MVSRARIWLVVLLAVIGGMIFSATGRVSAQAVVQSYNVSEPLQIGLIVEPAGAKSTVQPLTQAAASKMFGVVVSPNASPVTLSETSSATQAFVATSGDYSVLVSSQNGAIRPGDYITISSLNGFGMKAGTSAQFVLGKALGAFNGTGDSLGQTTLKNSVGQKTTVQLGRIAVDIAIGHNPLHKNPSESISDFLQRAAGNIVNKPVNLTRVYLSLLVLLASAVIASSLLYSGVRSSIIAIGRNPLSKRTVLRGLAEVILSSLVIFIIGLFAVYLLLRIT